MEDTDYFHIFAPSNITYCILKTNIITMEVEKIMQSLERKHPGELEYLQAVREVLESIKDCMIFSTSIVMIFVLSMQYVMFDGANI